MLIKTTYQGSSFLDMLQTDFAHLLPNVPSLPSNEQNAQASVPMGTTILAICYDDGVMIGGDRRAVSPAVPGHG